MSLRSRWIIAGKKGTRSLIVQYQLARNIADSLAISTCTNRLFSRSQKEPVSILLDTEIEGANEKHEKNPDRLAVSRTNEKLLLVRGG